MPTSSALGDPTKTLYLVDISSFIFRAFFAIRSLTNSKGEPTNAIYGVASMLARLVEDARPSYLAVVYDSKEPSFRKEVYTEYKANRSAPPDDLIPQFDKIEELVQCMGIHSYRQSGVEADDLIATLTGEWIEASPDHKVVVVTGDKDLMQLVEDRVVVWDTMKNEFFGPAEVQAKFGVRPDQIRDYLGLIGDSSDNIPGVPSIGPKSAVGLLQEFGDLEKVLAAASEGKIKGKKGEVLQAHVEDARLSARLATLKMDCPLKLDPELVKYEFSVSDRCAQFLKAMDFHTLLGKWGKYIGDGGSSRSVGGMAAAQPFSAATSAQVSGSADGGLFMPSPADVLVAGADSFRTVNTEEAFQEVLKGIERTGWFGFDVETTSLNPREAKLVGVAICYDPEFACYIPIGHRAPDAKQLTLSRVLEGLKPYLEAPKYGKIGQNLKYDFSVMLEHGIRPCGILGDTMIAAYVLEQQGRHNLQTLAAQYLSYRVMTYEEVCGEKGRGKTQLCFDEVPIETATRYSAEDAWVAVRLWQTLKPRLEKEGLKPIYEDVDLPLVPILAKMESQGVCIDEAWLADLSSEFDKDLKKIEEGIQKYTKEPVNLNSPKQLATLLFEELKLPVQAKTKTGYSTDATVLEALAPLHEVPRLLLEYREISKLKGTYVDPLPEMRDAKTGKIHASFNQAVAATGRLSGSDPNLQNIPIRTERGQKIRRAFIPSKGNLLLSADYSQIELRILAHMSGDPDLTGSFQREEDVHRRTASEIFEIAPEKVDDRQRGIAKAVNFGLMYGKSAFGLAQELRISRAEASDVIKRYFERYSGVKRFLDGLIIGAKERGYVETLLGRKRHLPDIRSKNHAVRQNAERMAMNTPIQGTAADLIKIAMIRIDEELEKRKLKSKLIIQVHDEVVLDCPKDEAKEVEALVVSLMENAMKLDVPLKVNSALGENWMDL